MKLASGRYARILFDVDGTLLLGERTLPGAVETVAACRAAGVEVRFGTNASFVTAAGLVRRLRAAGIDARPGDAIAALDVMAAFLGSRRVPVLAPDAVRSLLADLGVQVGEPDPPWIDVVVAGPSAGVRDEQVAAAAARIDERTRILVPNLDAGMVTESGVAPGAAAVVARLQAATEPVVVGKPGRTFIDAVEASFAGDGPTLVVGDSQADVDLAAAAGWDSLLVLSGISDQPHPAATMVARGLDS